MRNESYKAENADEIVWLRLNRLKSTNLCKKLIENKLERAGSSLDTKVIESKALGLSSAIESAIGYWEQNSTSLNSKVLSRYYFMLQLTIAEQVSNIKNTDNLASVQKHTEQGHGLGTIRDTKKGFPEDYFTFSLMGGHFYSYSKSLGQTPKDFSLERRPRKFEEISDVEKIVNIDDLFRRVPELNGVIEEYTGKLPLCFNIGYSSKNSEEQLERAAEHIQKTGEFVLKDPSENTTDKKTSLISFYEESEKIDIEYLKKIEFPFYDYHIDEDLFSNSKNICAKFDHSTKHWHQQLDTYSSSYCPTSIIAPLWGKVTDPIIINFTLLYTLSIIVRYLPDLWFEIQSGKLDHYGSLIEYYTSVLDHVVPLQMLERITDTNITIHQPGSIFGPM